MILVAHGVGNDDVNDYWLTLLDNLAAQIRVLGGDEFRAIEVATWREDWPDKRDEWVERVRAMVETAQAGGGRALVVPARTNSGGPEDEFLEGLEYALADGFAPHPLFTRWVDAQIRDGMAILTDREIAAVAHRE